MFLLKIVCNFTYPEGQAGKVLPEKKHGFTIIRRDADGCVTNMYLFFQCTLRGRVEHLLLSTARRPDRLHGNKAQTGVSLNH